MVRGTQRGGGVALGVEVEDQHPLAELGEGGGDVHRRRGLADAALLVGHHHHAGALGARHRDAAAGRRGGPARSSPRPAPAASSRRRSWAAGRSGRRRCAPAATLPGADVSRETAARPSAPRAVPNWCQPVEKPVRPVEEHARRATPDRWKTAWGRRPDPRANRVRSGRSHTPPLLSRALVRARAARPDDRSRGDRANLPARSRAGPPGPPRSARSSTSRSRARPPPACAQPSFRSSGPACHDLRRRRGPLHRHQLAAGRDQGQAPASSRSSGATARAVTTSNVRPPGQLLGPPAQHLDLVLQAQQRRRPRRGSGYAAAAARPG